MGLDISSEELADRLIKIRKTLPEKDELFYRFSEVMGHSLKFLGDAKPDRIEHVFVETADYIINHREFRNKHHSTAIDNFIDSERPLKCEEYILDLAEHVLGDTIYIDSVRERLNPAPRRNNS